jgi:hypothetical protein
MVTPISAQSDQTESQRPPNLYTFSYTPVYQFETDLKGGGKFDVTRHFFRFDVMRPFSKELMMGLGLSYDFEKWNFSGVSNVAGATPWSKIHRPGISLPISYSMSQNWRFGFTPAIEFSGESGAELDQSFTYGGVFSLAHSIDSSFHLGLGLGIFNQLEKYKFFPFIIINWKITEQLRLSNPFRAGPAGPAGLELIYTPTTKWELGIGGAYRSYRFRLDDKSAEPNGIGEVEFLATFVRIGRKLGSNLSIDLAGGALFDGKLTIENASGNDIGSTEYDPAPFLALTFDGRF